MSRLGEYAEPVDSQCEKCGVELSGEWDYCGPCGEYLRFKNDDE
jgi:hypothetical protein